MFEPIQYGLGLVWGAVSAPFKWLWNGIGSAFNGGLTGGVWGAGIAVGLQLLGEPLLALASNWIPSLGEAGWFESVRHFVASTTFVEKLVLLAPAGAAVGGTIGLVSAIPQTISENQMSVPERIDPVTQQPVVVNGLERGQNHGVVLGTIVGAVGVGAMILGAAKQFGLLGVSGGDEVAEAPAPSPVAAADTPRVVERT